MQIPRSTLYDWMRTLELRYPDVAWYSKKGRKRSLGREVWSMKRTLVSGAKAAGMFFSICVLWSLWMSPDVGEWFGLWKTMASQGSKNLPTLALVALVFLAYAGMSVAVNGDFFANYRLLVPAISSASSRTTHARSVRFRVPRRKWS